MHSSQIRRGAPVRQDSHRKAVGLCTSLPTTACPFPQKEQWRSRVSRLCRVSQNTAVQSRLVADGRSDRQYHMPVPSLISSVWGEPVRRLDRGHRCG